MKEKSARLFPYATFLGFTPTPITNERLLNGWQPKMKLAERRMSSRVTMSGKYLFAQYQLIPCEMMEPLLPQPVP